MHVSLFVCMPRTSLCVQRSVLSINGLGTASIETFIDQARRALVGRESVSCEARCRTERSQF